jgi:hypothetical protein
MNAVALSLTHRHAIFIVAFFAAVVAYDNPLQQRTFFQKRERPDRVIDLGGNVLR